MHEKGGTVSRSRYEDNRKSLEPKVRNLSRPFTLRMGAPALLLISLLMVT